MGSLRAHRGVSLVDVVVGSALFLIIFLGLFAILRASIAVSGLAKLKAAATAIATSQIEYIRSLDYDAVGTVAGIPSGNIPQNATTTQAGLEFDVRTYIIYADDPADGEGASDATGIITDYKRAKVVVSYDVQGVERSVSLVTTVAPPGIESDAGGGTIRVNVVDALGAAVSGAGVHIVNATLVPAVDIETFSDSTGQVLLPGAPASTDYEVYVSKTGYSSAQTYERDATNQNPTPGYLTVAEGQTTTGTFAIDQLATLVVNTLSPAAAASFSDTFSSSAQIAASSNVTVAGGEVVLAGAPGSYASGGDLRATATTPSDLESWSAAEATFTTPLNTGGVFRVVDGAGNPLPDAVVPGNGSGFTSSVDLSGVSTTTYPTLALSASLWTSDANETAHLLYWELAYEAGPAPIADVPFTLTGAKTVGSEISGTPIYKTIVSTTTDSVGTRTLFLEWDSYDFTATGYTLTSSDPSVPLELLPGATVNANLILTP
jgi:hypothetical protein